MRLFISYARLDKIYCGEIVNLLRDMHEVWCDKRLSVGQLWWEEIVNALCQCDGYIYLCSPTSVNSEYCRRELELALNLKKPIFPILITMGTQVPESIRHIQYVDLSDGLNVTAVKTLLGALLVAERKLMQVSGGAPTPPPVTISTPMISTANMPALTPVTPSLPPSAAASVHTLLPGGIPALPEPSPASAEKLYLDAVRAYADCDNDRAVHLFKQVIASGYKSRFLHIETMLRQAEEALTRDAYLKEAKREYAPIAALLKNESTRALGVAAFRAFHNTFPDFDPENLLQIYEQAVLTRPPFDLRREMPLLEWCHIPSGEVTISRNRVKKTFQVGEFYLSKYPVTNAQFQVFIDAADGYRNSAWWQTSPEVRKWHKEHPKPLEAPPNRDNYPRASVCWHEATAFCQWLSYKTGYSIKLPTEQQWQRAAQGDTPYKYPWGQRFDRFLCNCKESEIRGTTLVTQYPKSASPYGVVDMLGNVWEWCSNGYASGEITDVTVDILRVVRGGSFMSPKRRTNIGFFYHLNPLYRYQSIGFRIACEADAVFPGV